MRVLTATAYIDGRDAGQRVIKVKDDQLLKNAEITIPVTAGLLGGSFEVKVLIEFDPPIGHGGGA